MADKKTKKKGNELDEMSLDELIEKCKQIKELLSNLENQYRSAAITEQSYKQTKDANSKKLAEVKKRLEEWGVKDEDIPAPAAAPSAAPNPATSNSAAPAAASAAAPITPGSAPSPAAQKTASVLVPPPEQAPAFTPPIESGQAAETPAAPAPAGAPMSFTQKIKQQFMQSAPKASEDPAYISQTVQLELQKFQEKFNVELERIKATMDAIKETRSAADERMQMLTEGLAELRSNVFQREAGIKEQEMKLTKLKEMIDDIEPQKISKEFSKRDKTSNDVELRVEKLEVKTGDLSKTINEINALLKSIGGLENVANLDHEASKKLEKIQEMNKSIERLSLKTEKIFVDMNKRLEKFNIYEARQDNMSEVVNDMIRNFDALSIKFESYAEKKDLTTVKEDIADIQKKMEEFKKTLKKAVPFAEAQIPENLAAMQTEIDDVESLLSSIEYGHEKKQIKDDEYAAMKEKNEARMKEIKQKIAEAMKQIVPASESSADTNAKKQAPSLVNAMLDDKKAIDAAAKKNAEEAMQKEDAAKAKAENAPEAGESESDEDAEKTGDEENGADEESEEENGNGEEQESGDNAEEAEKEKEIALKTKDAPNSKEPEPVAEKAEPAKEKSSGKKKETVSKKADDKTNGGTPSDETTKTIAPADASGKTVQKDAPKKPRKSLRASEGLFVPAKEIAAIKSAVSPAMPGAEQFAEIAKDTNHENPSDFQAVSKLKHGASTVESEKATTAPADSVKSENKKSDKINASPEPVSAPEQKEEKNEENPLFAELDESLKEGLISKETYENTKKLLMMG